MNNLLCWIPRLGGVGSILYSQPHLTPFKKKVTLSVICLASLLFLNSGLTGEKGVRNRERRLASLTGLTGLLYVGLALFWYFHSRFLQPRAVAIGYYFAWHLAGGAALGLFLYLGFPKAAKVLFTASCLLFVAFNVFVVTRHLASVTLFLCLGNSLIIGVLIPSAVVLWLDQRKTNNQNGNPVRATSAATDGIGKDA